MATDKIVENLLSLYVAADPPGERKVGKVNVGCVKPEICGVVLVLLSMTRLLSPPSTQKRMVCMKKNTSASGKEHYNFLY